MLLVTNYLRTVDPSSSTLPSSAAKGSSGWRRFFVSGFSGPSDRSCLSRSIVWATHPFAPKRHPWRDECSTKRLGKTTGNFFTSWTRPRYPRPCRRPRVGSSNSGQHPTTRSHGSLPSIIRSSAFATSLPPSRSSRAGTLPNSLGALEGWISNAPAIKPGTQMPKITEYTGREVRALAAYVYSLK